MFKLSLLMAMTGYIYASYQGSIPWKLLHKDINYSLESETNKSYKQNPKHYYAGLDLDGPNPVKDLREKLNRVLNFSHIISQSKEDKLIEDCELAGPQSFCYEHRIYDYRSARKVLFGQLYLQSQPLKESEEETIYYVTDQYCHQNFSNQDIFFDELLKIGPDKIPNPNILNTEHLWPKSRFNDVGQMLQSRSYPYEMKLSDLHHLIPTDSRANGDRSSYKFGEVSLPIREMKCSELSLGIVKNDSSDTHATSLDPSKQEYYFEPPDRLKGDIARSLFYFSVKYEVPITKLEESFLRKWHKQDPVDEFEIDRNNIIHNFQGVRNPFIDYPHLEEQFLDF